MTTDISLPLYHHLCQTLGTEDIVKMRRLCYAICNYLSPVSSRFFFFGRHFTTWIFSGSKAEGLDLKTSDLDIMCVIQFVTIFEDPMDEFGFLSFLLSSEYTKPGYVRLKLHCSVTQEIHKMCKEREGHVFLSSELVKKPLLHFTNKYIDVFIHGPCLTLTDESHDIVFCLRYKSWVDQAQEWVFRNRVWPSNELVSQIVSYGVLFVPIGSKDSRNEDLEWRISFSVAEKYLIYSFTHTQFLSYALLKVLLKEVIDLNAICKGLLCSYFIKTLVFWVSEEMSSWQPKNFMSNFNRLIFRLRYYVQISFLPHYFISENNLFENRFNSQQQKILINMLTNIYRKGFFSFVNSESMSDFFASDPTSLNFFSGFDYELINTPLSVLNILPGASLNTLVVLSNRYNLRSHRYLYTLFWSAICQQIGHVQIGIQERSNKDQYKRYKTYLPYLVMGLQKDAVTGWLSLASYFFSVDSFNKCLNIIDYILHKCCLEETWDITSLELEAMQYGVINAHIICRRHFVDLFGFRVNFAIRPLKLKLEFLDNLRPICSPLAYTFFLRFMCRYHLHDFSGFQCALRDLQRVRSGCPFDDYCLGLAYYTLMDYVNALYIFIPFSMLLRSVYYKYRSPFLADLVFKLDLVIQKLKTAVS